MNGRTNQSTQQARLMTISRDGGT